MIRTAPAQHRIAFTPLSPLVVVLIIIVAVDVLRVRMIHTAPAQNRIVQLMKNIDVKRAQMIHTALAQHRTALSTVLAVVSSMVV